MLQAIRVHSQGWLAWIIVALISVPFALWGIQEYVKVGRQQSVATVNGQEIQERELNQQVQETRLRLRKSLGQAYRPDMLDQALLRGEVLKEIIRNQLVVDNSVNMGLRVGDGQVRAAILAIPAFQKDGVFDNDVYQQALLRQRITSVQLEERVRMSLLTTQLNRVVSSSEFVTEQEVAEVVRLRKQQRSFKYFVLSSALFKNDTPITEADLNSYYQTHRDSFEIPEQVKLDYLVLGQTDGGSATSVTEASLQALYQSHLEQYRTPEQRQIRHILITLAPQASTTDEQAAKERIADIRSRIIGGADFATVAKETSQDPGSAPNGGDLGLVGRGIMVAEFEQAAFALATGVLSEPVRSTFGLHLIEVTKIEPERVKSFAEARDELMTVAKTEELTKHYLRMAEQLARLTYEHVDSLEPAAQALGLKIQHSDWLSRSGGTKIFANRKIVNAAFTDAVLTQGNNSDLIEITEENQPQAVVLRVVDHQDTAIKPLAEVKEQIITVLRQEQATKAAFKQAEILAARLRKGEAITQVATNYPVVEQQLMQRDAAGDVSPEIINAVFKLPIAATGAVSVDVIQTKDGAAVVVLGAVQDGKPTDLDENQRKTERDKVTQIRVRAYYGSMINDLQQRAKIWIAPQSERAVAVDGDL